MDAAPLRYGFHSNLWKAGRLPNRHSAEAFTRNPKTFQRGEAKILRGKFL
jgi:hypothetical protein